MLRFASALRLALTRSPFASILSATTGNVGARSEDLLTLDNGTVKVGIDRAKWTGFEPDMPDVVVVRCEFTATRAEGDRWGPAKLAAEKPDLARELNQLITEFLADTEAVVPVRNPNYSPKATATDGSTKKKMQAKKA